MAKSDVFGNDVPQRMDIILLVALTVISQSI